MGGIISRVFGWDFRAEPSVEFSDGTFGQDHRLLFLQDFRRNLRVGFLGGIISRVFGWDFRAEPSVEFSDGTFRAEPSASFPPGFSSEIFGQNHRLGFRTGIFERVGITDLDSTSGPIQNGDQVVISSVHRLDFRAARTGFGYHRPAATSSLLTTDPQQHRVC